MFTVNDFEDLINVINSHPEWRQRLRQAIYPEVDLVSALREMAEAIAKLSVGQAELLKRVGTIEENVSTLQQDVTVLKQDMKFVKTDLAKLKGRSQEEFYRGRADSVFGVYLRKGMNATAWIADLLHDKVADGIITLDDVRQVLAADMLWSAETRDSKLPVVVVMEASWLAEESDVKRVLARAEVLWRVGVKAVPVVGGEAWSDSARQSALDAQVATTHNGRLDHDSWLRALARVA